MKSYQDLLRRIRDTGEDHDDRTGVGTTSLFGEHWTHDMQEGFPLLTTKKVPLRWVFEELRWFLSGSTDERDLAAQGVDIWKEWATEEQCAKFGRKKGDLGPVYGSLWRAFPFGPVPGNDVKGSTDQIVTLLQDLKHNPGSRRLLVSGWQPYYATRVALPPCHTLWQARAHQDHSISLHLYARSIDSFLGLPFNIASYALLLTMLGHVTDRTPNRLAISFGDVHIYNNHHEAVETQLTRSPRKLPTVRFTSDAPKNLFEFRWEHLLLENYDPHPKIAAEVAV